MRVTAQVARQLYQCSGSAAGHKHPTTVGQQWWPVAWCWPSLHHIAMKIVSDKIFINSYLIASWKMVDSLVWEQGLEYVWVRV